MDKNEKVEEAPTLGINVADGINMREKFGAGPMDPPPVPVGEVAFEANALALVTLAEDGTFISLAPTHVFLNRDKSPKRFMKGLVYNFHFRVEGR